ncbi:hypothetical protein Scep_019479 [Stephania cephalantha]|uniref:Uncharacterized protein n=1 Tax=Stephania cephalantha TaxID=152367 RepID=A0AAP0IB91_9MAGN
MSHHLQPSLSIPLSLARALDSLFFIFTSNRLRHFSNHRSRTFFTTAPPLPRLFCSRSDHTTESRLPAGRAKRRSAIILDPAARHCFDCRSSFGILIVHVIYVFQILFGVVYWVER